MTVFFDSFLTEYIEILRDMIYNYFQSKYLIIWKLLELF